MTSTSEPIFKRDSAGKIRSWQYEVDGARYRTIAGIAGGNLVTSAWTDTSPKNVGRSNETTAEQQAVAEAVAERNKKLDREYRRTVEELDSVATAPMLARDFAKEKTVTFPVYSQPKLDGIRALITRDGAFSRKYQRHQNVDHILEAMAPAFKLNPNLIFDGELYNHDLRDNFNAITSVVRREAATDAERAEARKVIQFHCYDIVSDSPFSTRSLIISGMFGDNVIPGVVAVPTRLTTNAEELDCLYGQYLEAGYEGQMVRLDRPYEADKRSKTLLKRKEFMATEFPVSRIIEGTGNWAGYAKAVEFILPDDKRLENGDRPQAGMRGSKAFAKDILMKERSGNRPKETTIRFFGYTPGGIPRFPVAIDFHQNGRRD